MLTHICTFQAPTPPIEAPAREPTPPAPRPAPTAQRKSAPAKLPPQATASTSASTTSGSSSSSVRISRGPAASKSSASSSKPNPRRSFDGKRESPFFLFLCTRTFSLLIPPHTALSALVTGVRRPGLGKRTSIPTLHPNRNPNPTSRAPLAVARSKADERADAELDSDEERARANETPEQRMRRKIREAEEEYMEPPAGWEKMDTMKTLATGEGGWEENRYEGGDGGEGMAAEYAEYD